VFIGEVGINKTIQTKDSYVYNENFDVAALNVPVVIQILNDTSQVSCGGYTSDVCILKDHLSHSTIFACIVSYRFVK